MYARAYAWMASQLTGVVTSLTSRRMLAAARMMTAYLQMVVKRFWSRFCSSGVQVSRMLRQESASHPLDRGEQR